MYLQVNYDPLQLVLHALTISLQLHYNVSTITYRSHHNVFSVTYTILCSFICTYVHVSLMQVRYVRMLVCTVCEHKNDTLYIIKSHVHTYQYLKHTVYCKYIRTYVHEAVHIHTYIHIMYLGTYIILG